MGFSVISGLQVRALPPEPGKSNRAIVCFLLYYGVKEITNEN